jgi:hypothetical protein
MGTGRVWKSGSKRSAKHSGRSPAKPTTTENSSGRNRGETSAAAGEKCCRFSRPVHDSRKDRSRLEIRDHEPGEVPTVVPSAPHDSYHTSLPPEVAKIVGAALPAPVKVAMLAIVVLTARRLRGTHLFDFLIFPKRSRPGQRTGFVQQALQPGKCHDRNPPGKKLHG